jgi:hypothetical protein
MRKKLKFYQIVMSDNPVSMEYHEISKKSFEPVSDIVEIVPFEAITPQHEDWENIESKYNWKVSLAGLDKKDSEKRQMSPSEKAGICSHFELIRQRSLTDEDFWVTEHDTFLLPEQEDNFRRQVYLSHRLTHVYSNIGLFMGCYRIDKSFAQWSHHILTKGDNRGFPINGGPYACMERLFKTYITDHYCRDKEYKLRHETFVAPWHNCTELGRGKTDRDMRRIYNFDYNLARGINPPFTPEEIKQKKESLEWVPIPTTQVIKKSLKVTQDHTGYVNRFREKPWERHPYFHVID